MELGDTCLFSEKVVRVSLPRPCVGRVDVFVLWFGEQRGRTKWARMDHPTS